jgi:hypothetical protein
MPSKKISIYTEAEEKFLNQLIIDSKDGLITDLYDKALPLMKVCEDRKNRIRENRITEEDRKNGFTSENFSYLMNSKYYSKNEITNKQ